MKTEEIIKSELENFANSVIDYFDLNKDNLSIRMVKMVEHNNLSLENLNLFLKDCEYEVYNHDYYFQDNGENFSLIFANYGEIEVSENMIDHDCIDDFHINGNGYAYYPIPLVEIVFNQLDLLTNIKDFSENR